MSATRATSLFIATLCLATPAHAQMTVTVDRHVSIAEVGAAGLIQGPRESDRDGSTTTYPDVGIAALGALYPTEIVGVAGELAAFASSLHHGRTALAGVRLRTPLITSGTTHFRVFGQVLSGPRWTDLTAARRRVLQPGVGAEDYLRNGVTLHVQYDYTFAHGEERDLATGRFLVGFAVPVGSR